jgi:hypothetical protein
MGSIDASDEGIDADVIAEPEVEAEPEPSDD